MLPIFFVSISRISVLQRRYLRLSRQQMHVDQGLRLQHQEDWLRMLQKLHRLSRISLRGLLQVHIITCRIRRKKFAVSRSNEGYFLHLLAFSCGGLCPLPKHTDDILSALSTVEEIQDPIPELFEVTRWWLVIESQSFEHNQLDFHIQTPKAHASFLSLVHVFVRDGIKIPSGL